MSNEVTRDLSAWEKIKEKEHKNPWEHKMTSHQKEVYDELCKENPDVSEEDFMDKYHEFWDENGKPKEGI